MFKKANVISNQYVEISFYDVGPVDIFIGFSVHHCH
jgi:hypothetical protein